MMKLTSAVIALTVALQLTSALAQSNPRYVQFRPSATKGALYAPDSGPAPTVAFLAIHRTSNFMNMISTRELARRGFMVLGMNPRSDNNEAIVNFEDIALDIKQGVEFLRRQPGISKVILNGRVFGRRIDIQPTRAPSLVVSVSRLTPDPSLKVGATVTARGSKLGQVIDLSGVEKQALAQYTNDEGNHVLLEVHPAATLGS